MNKNVYVEVKTIVREEVISELEFLNTSTVDRLVDSISRRTDKAIFNHIVEVTKKHKP